MSSEAQTRVVRTLYRSIFRFCKALDTSAPNAVNGQLVKLSAHLKVPSVYTSLAKSALRAYPQRILMESTLASNAAQQLFRMPLPSNEYEAKQEVEYRVDMAFAALRFLNDRYSHVVEQRNDVVKLKDWVNIIKRAERVEDGAIAIARASDATVEAAAVYTELDNIAELVRGRIAAMEKLALGQANPDSAGDSARVPDDNEANKENRHSLQEYSVQCLLNSLEDPIFRNTDSAHSHPRKMMPSNQPDNRNSLLEAAARVAMGMEVDEASLKPMAQGDSVYLNADLMMNTDNSASIKSAQASTNALSVSEKLARHLKVPLALHALNQVLFQELGFSGNRQDYYEPSNSMIHHVIQKRKGNPITLSVVYLAVARRVGLNLSGVECPSHFVVRGTNEDGELYFVDTFNGGKVMSLHSCKEMFLTARTAMVDEKDLSPVIPVQIYSRIMRNLVNSHMILGNGDKALLWTERLRVLEQANLSLIAPAQAVSEEPRGWRGRIGQPRSAGV